MPGIIEQLRAKGKGEGLTDTEAAFYRTNELNQNLRSESGVSDEEKLEFESAFGSFDDNISKFGPLIDVIGTEQESKIPEVLSAEPGVMSKLGESIGFVDDPEGDAFRHSMMQNIVPPSQEARAIGTAEGISPLVNEAQSSLNSLMKALEESPPSLDGGLQFDRIVQNFKKFQGEAELSRDKLAKRFPDVTDSSLAAGNVISDLGLGLGTAFMATKGVRALPGLSTASKFPTVPGAGGAIAKAAPSVIGSGVGTAAESLSSAENTEDILREGLSGSAFDVAFRSMGPLGRVTGSVPFVKETVQKIRSSLLGTAFDSVYKALEPNQMAFRRGIERGGDDPQKIGKVFFEEEIPPDIPFLFLDKSMPIRLEKRIAERGAQLGALRNEADAVSKRMIARIQKDFDPSNLSQQELFAKEGLIKDINENYQVSRDKIARKIREVVVSSDHSLSDQQVKAIVDAGDIQIDNYIRRTPHGRAQSQLLQIADDIASDPKSHMTINAAVQKMQPFRKTVRQKGQPVDAVDVEVAKAMEGIFSNEIDNAASNALTIGRLLPDNFTQADIFKAAGLNAKRISGQMDEFSDIADLADLPEAKKLALISDLNEHSRLKEIYRILRKGESGLIEKQRQINKNKTISITDQMSGAAAFAAGGIDTALAATFMSNVIRRKGELSLGVGTKAIADGIRGLEVATGNRISGLKHVADTGTLAPFIFSDLLDPESPLNINGFAFIKNPQQVAEYKENVAEDESLSTVMRAKIINDINRTGILKIFKKGEATSKTDVGEGGGFQDFKKKLEQFTPRSEQTPGDPQAMDMSQSPLLNRGGQ